MNINRVRGADERLSRIMIELKNYLTGTREFAEVQYAYNNLRGNPDAYRLVTEFREKQERLASAGSSEAADGLLRELDRYYESLLRYPAIEAYFTAWDRFAMLLQGMMQDLNIAIEAELG